MSNYSECILKSILTPISDQYTYNKLEKTKSGIIILFVSNGVYKFNDKESERYITSSVEYIGKSNDGTLYCSNLRGIFKLDDVEMTITNIRTSTSINNSYNNNTDTYFFGNSGIYKLESELMLNRLYTYKVLSLISGSDGLIYFSTSDSLYRININNSISEIGLNYNFYNNINLIVKSKQHLYFCGDAGVFKLENDDTTKKISDIVFKLTISDNLNTYFCGDAGVFKLENDDTLTQINNQSCNKVFKSSNGIIYICLLNILYRLENDTLIKVFDKNIVVNSLIELNNYIFFSQEGNGSNNYASYGIYYIIDEYSQQELYSIIVFPPGDYQYRYMDSREGIIDNNGKLYYISASYQANSVNTPQKDYIGYLECPLPKCKYYKEQREVSKDGGLTWEALPEFRKGRLYERDSDCDLPEPLP